MLLIYPLISYKNEFFINENFEEEEKLFRIEIDQKRDNAIDAAGKEKKKINFDVKKECYIESVPNYMFELNIK